MVREWFGNLGLEGGGLSIAERLVANHRVVCLYWQSGGLVIVDWLIIC